MICFVCVCVCVCVCVFIFEINKNVHRIYSIMGAGCTTLTFVIVEVLFRGTKNHLNCVVCIKHKLM